MAYLTPTGFSSISHLRLLGIYAVAKTSSFTFILVFLGGEYLGKWKKNNHWFYLLLQEGTNSGRLFARTAKPFMVSPNIFNIITAFLFLAHNKHISTREPRRRNYKVNRPLKTCGFSVWNLLHASLLAPRIFNWLLDFFFKCVDFWKMVFLRRLPLYLPKMSSKRFDVRRITNKLFDKNATAGVHP